MHLIYFYLKIGNTPIHHTAHKPGQSPHFHPAKKDGTIKKDGAHYGYSQKKG